MIVFLRDFGIAPTLEDALSRVARRLEGDPAFRRQARGWRFYPLPTHIGVSVPDGTESAIDRIF